MAKKFRAFRFNPELYASFKEVVSACGYSVTGAFEKFMGVCVESNVLVFPEKPNVEDIEAEARIILDWLKKGKYWYRLGGEELSISGRLLTLLPKIQNRELKKDIEEGLKRSVEK